MNLFRRKIHWLIDGKPDYRFAKYLRMSMCKLNRILRRKGGVVLTDRGGNMRAVCPSKDLHRPYAWVIALGRK